MIVALVGLVACVLGLVVALYTALSFLLFCLIVGLV